jgi:peptidoglycan/LPS O-acetylase OafA/YrhL
MSSIEILVIIAMVGYAIYKQTQVSELKARGRFKLAIVYAAVGACVGGFVMPHGAPATALFVGSFVLSAIVGLLRGRLTRIWVADDGRIMRRGTALTVGLFLALIVAKFGIGTYEYLTHVRDSGGFGEVMVMIALMVAVQAEIVYRRGQELVRRSTSPLEAIPAAA